MCVWGGGGGVNLRSQTGCPAKHVVVPAVLVTSKALVSVHVDVQM